MALGPPFAASLITVLVAQAPGGAPSGAEPAAHQAENVPPALTAGVLVGASLRVGDSSRDVPPQAGVAVALLLGGRYARIATGRVGLGVQLNLGYTRHASRVRVSVPTADGPLVEIDSTRLVSTSHFTALQTVERIRGRLRPWAAAGGGLQLGYFFSEEPQYAPGESTVTSPVLHGAVGLEWEAVPQVSVGARCDWLHPFGDGRFATEAGPRLRLFGDHLLLAATVSSRF